MSVAIYLSICFGVLFLFFLCRRGGKGKDEENPGGDLRFVILFFLIVLRDETFTFLVSSRWHVLDIVAGEELQKFQIEVLKRRWTVGIDREGERKLRRCEFLCGW